LLDSVGGEHVGSDITKGESVVTMDVWDFAGQHLYYASHPMFLSSRAVYILVHDLSKPLQAPAQPCVRQGTSEIYLANPNNETNLDNLLSWLVTVHGIAQVKKETDIDAQNLPYLHPPVFIVGTHADKPAEDIAEMKSQIQARILGAEYGKHVVPPLFSIDNRCSNIWNKMKRFVSQGLKKRNHQTGIKLLMYGHLTCSKHHQVIMHPGSLESRKGAAETKSSFFSALQTSQEGTS